MGNLLRCLAVTWGLPCLLGSVGLSATGRLLAPAEIAAAEVLASPFRLAAALNAGMRLTAAREVEAGADAGANAGAEPEAGAEADAVAAGAMAVADVLRELTSAVVRTGAACCLGLYAEGLDFHQAVHATLVGGSRGSTSSTASMGALVLEGLGGLTGEAVKSVGARTSELMLHFPNTAKKVPQNCPGYPDWAGKCSKLIPELGPSALAHLFGHPVPGAARQSGEIQHFCIPYRIPGSVEPCCEHN